MVTEFDRITFIHPDGTSEQTEEVENGVVFDKRGRTCVALPFEVAALQTPDWVQTGSDIVAATDNGQVIEAFEIQDMTMQVSIPKSQQIKEDIPVGTLRLYHPR